MRKVLCSVCVMMGIALTAGSATAARNSAMDVGSAIVSGHFIFSSAGGDLYEFDGSRQTFIQFDPSFSFFFYPGLAAGGSLLVERLSQGSASMTTWGLGPQMVYFVGGNRYRPRLRGMTYPYLSTSFFFTSTSYSDDVFDSTTSGVMLSFSGGVMHMLSETIGVSGEINYQLDWRTPEGGSSLSGNTFNIGGGLTAFLF